LSPEAGPALMSRARDSYAPRLFLAAAAVRLGVLLVWKIKHLDAVFLKDPYADTALIWLSGGGDPGAIVRPPLYPAFLAALFSLFGSAKDWAVPLLQSLISAASPLLLLSWARRRLPEKQARLAAAWMAVDPGLLFFAPQLQTETLYVFLTLL